MDIIARVIPLLRLPRGLHFFDYAIPPELLVREGMLVRVPFRAANVRGVVIQIRKGRSRYSLKKIFGIITATPLLPSYFSAFLRALTKETSAAESTLLRLFLGHLTARALMPPTAPLLGKQYYTLRLPKASLPALKKLLNAKRTALFRWHHPHERLIAYCKLIERHLQNGSVLLLFPRWEEIEHFLSYLPRAYTNTTAVVTSDLPAATLTALWHDIASGKKKLIIGTRRALFAPLQKPSCIIVDGEHSYGWKEEQNPRYDARRVAEILGRLTKTKLIFSSPAPSLERQYALRRAIIATPPLQPPTIMIADLRESYATPHPFITETLREDLIALAPNDQALLFLNRKGYASTIVCRDCGAIPLCPECALPLTHHKDNTNDVLRCHHCVMTLPFPLTCTTCRGAALRPQGKGIERIEESIRTMFPSHSGIAVKTYSALESLYWGYGGATPPKLLAFIDFLSPLAMPDFRALDTLARNFTIAKNIAALFHIPLIIQTTNPEHPLFVDSAFAEHQLEERKKMRYPPFTRLVKLIVKDTNSEKAQKRCEALTPLLLGEGGVRSITISAPFPSHPAKRGKYYYWYRLARLLPTQSLRPLLKKIPSDILLDFDPETLL